MSKLIDGLIERYLALPDGVLVFIGAFAVIALVALLVSSC